MADLPNPSTEPLWRIRQACEAARWSLETARLRRLFAELEAAQQAEFVAREALLREMAWRATLALSA